MKKVLLFCAAWAILALAACVVAPGPGHERGGVVIAPALPAIVELSDPFFFYDNFHYYYHDNRWSYSRSKEGPWRDLPRDRYPRETRFKGRDGGRDSDRRNDEGRDGRRRGDRYDRDRRDDDRH